MDSSTSQIALTQHTKSLEMPALTVCMCLRVCVFIYKSAFLILYFDLSSATVKCSDQRPEELAIYHHHW